MYLIKNLKVPNYPIVYRLAKHIYYSFKYTFNLYLFRSSPPILNDTVKLKIENLYKAYFKLITTNNPKFYRTTTAASREPGQGVDDLLPHLCFVGQDGVAVVVFSLVRFSIDHLQKLSLVPTIE